MKRRPPLAHLIVPVLPLLLTATALACPFCKDSIPSSDAQAAGSVPGGFNNSIYLMLGGFFLVLGFVTMTLFKAARTPQVPRGFPVQGTGSSSAPHDPSKD